MADKVIIRSATIDSHGDYTPVEMLQEYVSAVNGEHKMRYLANHRRDIPPIGYFDNGEVQEINKVQHALVEPITFANRTIVEWDNKLLIEDAGKEIRFIERQQDETYDYRISIDKNNLPNMASLSETGKQLTSIYDGNVTLELNMRKTLLPDPQVVITLAKYTLILYPLLKPFLSKMGEKIAEDIADDVYKACKSSAKSVISKLSNSVRVIRKDMIPKNKVLRTIFEIPGEPYIELHIKSDDPLKVEKGLNPSNLFRVHQKIIHLQKQLDIFEIYFVLNTKDKWDFQYLITNNGNIVGTPDAFKKRDKLVSRIQLSPTKAFSIGAEGVQYELQRREDRLPPPEDQ